MAHRKPRSQKRDLGHPDFCLHLPQRLRERGDCWRPRQDLNLCRRLERECPGCFAGFAGMRKNVQISNGDRGLRAILPCAGLHGFSAVWSELSHHRVTRICVAMQHLRPVVPYVSHKRTGRSHLHLFRRERPEQIDRRLLCHLSREPASIVPAMQNHRHPGMN